LANLVAGRQSSHLLASASFAVIVLGTAVPAQGQNWDGSESADWRDGNNWVGGSAPTGAGTVQLSDTIPNPGIPVATMPTIDGGGVTINTALIGYSQAQGGITLTISNGASFVATSVIVGEGNNAMALADRATQSGTVNLLGGSTSTVNSLTIGSYGDGVVNITGASKVTAGSLALGSNRTPPHVASGRLTISGAGSAMTVTSTSATIGNAGEGIVSVDSGGKLTTDSLALGIQALSSGTITITGAGSQWVRSAGTLNIGQSGTGVVTVSNGGVANFLSGTGQVNLALNAGSSGSLTVTGNDSRFEAGQLFVGLLSNATVSATAGGVVKATQLRLGTAAAGTGTANISGVGSEIEASTHAMIGVSGRGILNLSDNATLRTPILNVALLAGSNGTLNIGGAAGSAALTPGTVAAPQVTFGTGAGTLVFNHTGADYTFAPLLSGAGTVRHLAGTTTLTGNSTAFTGTTRVEGGLLRVNQRLTGAMTVMSGGTLGGSGTVGATQINTGGTIAPDGTLNVAGNLTFDNGSLYRVDTGGGATDLIAATGAVAINGGNVVVQTPSGHFNWQEDHRILSAGTALTGTFGGVTSQMVFLDSALDYSRPNEVWLGFNRNSTTFASVGATPNQQSVGQALGGLPDTNPVVSAMSVLTVDQARNALDQLAGDTHSTLQGVNGALANQVQDMITNRVRQSFTTLDTDDAASSYLATGEASSQNQVPTFWLQGLGEHMRVDSNGGAGGLSIGSAGLIGGADMQLLDDWRVGIAGGYARSSFSAIGRPASATSDNLYAGIYAGAQFDAVRLQLSAQHTWHGLSTKRDVEFGVFTDTLAADYWAQTSQVHGELGYVFDLGAVEIEPFGSLSYALTNTPAFTETGGVAALSSAAAHSDAAVTVLGTRLEAPFALENMLVTVRGMVGW